MKEVELKVKLMIMKRAKHIHDLYLMEGDES